MAVNLSPRWLQPSDVPSIVADYRASAGIDVPVYLASQAKAVEGSTVSALTG